MTVEIDLTKLSPAGREFYKNLREKQEKERLAAMPVKRPATIAIDAMVAPSLKNLDPKADLSAKAAPAPVFDVKTPTLKTADTIGRQVVDDLSRKEPAKPPADWTWDELFEIGRAGDHIPDTRKMVCGIPNPDYDENYIPPDDGLVF